MDPLIIAIIVAVFTLIVLFSGIPIAFGLSFELPIVLLILVKVGITSPDGLRKKRRYAIVVAFVAAAILTPPDPLSQLALALPIIMLYEASIFIASKMMKSIQTEEAEET